MYTTSDLQCLHSPRACGRSSFARYWNRFLVAVCKCAFRREFSVCCMNQRNTIILYPGTVPAFHPLSVMFFWERATRSQYRVTCSGVCIARSLSRPGEGRGRGGQCGLRICAVPKRANRATYHGTKSIQTMTRLWPRQAPRGLKEDCTGVGLHCVNMAISQSLHQNICIDQPKGRVFSANCHHAKSVVQAWQAMSAQK